MTMNIRRRAVLLGAAASAINLASSNSGVAAEKKSSALDKISIAYGSPVPGPEGVFLFAGMQKGYFAEEKIEIDIQYATGAVAAAGFVASQTFDMSWGGLEAMPTYIDRGLDITCPFVGVYEPYFALAFLSGNAVRNPNQLKGKKVGVSGLGSASIPVLEYILKQVGLPSTDVTMIPIGVGPAAIVALNSGTVDALMYHKSGLVELEASGVKLEQYASSLETAYPGQGFLALSSTLKAKNDALKRFFKALVRSIRWSVENSEASIAATIKLYPEMGKDLTLLNKAWAKQVELMTPPAWANGRFGTMNDEGWNNFLNVLTESKLIKARPDIGKLFASEFVIAAN